MARELRDAVIVAYGRSAVGKSGKKGVFRNTHPVEMGGTVIKGILEKIPQLDPALVEDVIVGCAKPQAEQGGNMARIIAMRAGLPWSACGQTVNRFCSSGLQTISTAANMIMTGQSDCIIAGGCESMTAIPMGPAGAPVREAWVEEHEPGIYLSMGLTAENVAADYHVTRQEMEELAVESHRRAAEATEKGLFKDQIIPVRGVDEEGNEITVTVDQGIRKGTSMESLAKLKPCFKDDGVVTAALASQTSDGAGFVVMMSAEKAKEVGLKPIARFVGFAVAGCDPSRMGLGPIYAVPKVLKVTGLKVEDMDRIELNEAFAAQAIPCIKTLGFDLAKTNVNGGAMALGHPLGATGGILTCKLLAELERCGGKYGMVTMCIGGGQGAAGIFEML